MKTNKKQAFWVGILGSVFALTFVAGPAHAAKTLVYCSEGSPSTFNPQIATDGTTYTNTSAIYNRLVEFKYGETSVEPMLAESWSTSKDGMTYTFKLRKGVKFQTTAYFTPTREFNADDVLFTFNRQRLKDHPFHKVSGGSYEYFDSMEMGRIIKDIVKVDAHTVKFVLSQAEAPFLANLAMDFASILSAEYGDTLMKAGKPEKMDIEPVGTGPFTFVRYDKDQSVRYKTNPDYFKGRAKFDQLVFSITQDPSVRFQKLKTGECNLVTEPAPQDLKAMSADPKLQVMQAPGLNVGYLAMNVEKKPFNNPLVRQAINMALDRKSYIDAIYLGNAVIAKNPFPPSMWSFNNSVKDYEHNPAKAKELLAKAGLPNGFEAELWTLPVSRPYNPNGKKMGEMMQADLAKVGIKVKLVTYDWPTYLKKTKEGDHQIVQMGWTGDNGDPDNFMNVLLGCASVKAGSNLARWCDKDFNELVQKAKMTPDKAKRTKFYKQAQEEFKKAAPWVTLAHSVVYRAMGKNVHGFKINPFGTDQFHEVELK
ncbi:MAG: ABC transporter substrate-binding protein [Bacteriovoracia bacterium]